MLFRHLFTILGWGQTVQHRWCNTIVFSHDFFAQGGTSISGGRGGLAPKFASEILVGAPNFASKNLDDKYPKFCPLDCRFDPKIGIFPQLLRLVITELPKFFLLFGEIDRTLAQILPLNLMSGPSPPPDLLIWRHTPGPLCSC